MRGFFVAAVVVTLAIAFSARASAETFTEVCGVVKAYTPATATTGGSIMVGTRTLAIPAGGTESTVNEPARVGVAQCASVFVADNGRVLFGAMTMPTSFCGRITAQDASTATSAGAITLSDALSFVVPAGTTLPTFPFNSYHCFSLTLTGQGGAAVVMEIPPGPVQPAVSTPAPGSSQAPRQLPNTSTSR